MITPMKAAMRAAKGSRPQTIDARAQFDALMEHVLPPDGITFEAASVGDIPGLCVRPPSSRADEVILHLGRADANDPLASPLQGSFSGLPPIRIDVGDDEVLLDESRRYLERAAAAGGDARLEVWMGMFHGFVGSIGIIKAATLALDGIGAFLAERLQNGHP